MKQFKQKQTRKTLKLQRFQIANEAQLKTKVDDNGRVCTKCLEYKTWDNFNNSTKTVTGKQSSCRQCATEKRNSVPRIRNTKKEKERAKEYSDFLKKNDPLKKKAQQLRGGFRNRSKDGLFVPSAPDIEKWLKSISPFICHYSGVELKQDSFSVDHKIPLDRGGDNSFSNLCICTKQMNTTKGTMTEKEFKSLLKFLLKWEDKGSKLLSRLRMAGKAFGR